MRGNTARVAKLGQRRKIQGLILSGSGVQIPSLAPVFHTSCVFTEPAYPYPLELHCIQTMVICTLYEQIELEYFLDIYATLLETTMKN